MKILVVIPLVYGGGAEQVAAVLSREWAQTHAVRVLAFNAAGEQLDFGVPIEDMGLPAQAGVWRRLKIAWQRVARVGCVAREFKPDAVMAFMDEAGMVCALAGLRSGWLGRLVVSVHHNPQWLSRGRRALLALFYRLPAAVVAVSQGVRDELAVALGLPATRLRHIPNPLVLREDEGVAESRQLAESLPADFVLFVGRLDRHTKGLDVLLEAYAAFPAARPALVIVGDGPDRDWLAAELVRLDLHDVHCVGWQRDPQPFYRRARLFVMCSRFEGWSNVLMEAMGQGCLVLASRCPYGPPEILGPDFPDRLLPVGDVMALSAAMQAQLALDDDARVVLQGRLRQRAASFAAPAVAQQWITLAEGLR
ncbi:glycosyltransferase [Uliginosibacterium sp. 31-16]|uniref:glycosyltransferase n=1 Tax=Uliginosibacterium sp. 31-16 TaxID=3068315 RepID=UPI00273D3103|nr:glycosyltransferase [Uliginosibacterium sp. 31-16]MDP5240606.1 glycosyltransferase [Uliginosibacterium sp. 31-16]